MNRICYVLIAVVLAASVVSAEGNPKRAKALARVDALIESGHLDEADALLTHLTRHNPEDPDLKKLREKLLVRQGKLETVLAEGDALAAPERRPELRAACWRIVAATATGSPEEIRNLVGVGDEARLREVLAVLKLAEAEAPRAVAAEVLAVLGDAEARARLDARVKAGDLSALRCVPDEMAGAYRDHIVRALGGDTPPEVACELAARLRLKSTRARLVVVLKKGDPSNRVAAAGALLALGEKSARRVLGTVFSSGTPSESVTALTGRAAHPGAGRTPRLKLLARVEKAPPVPRLKGTMVDVVLAALGRSKEPGARDELLARLKTRGSALTAARALGELGDDGAVPGVLAYLRKPPKAAAGEASATAGGLDFLGGGAGSPEMKRAMALEPRLVAAIALLRMTRPE